MKKVLVSVMMVAALAVGSAVAQKSEKAASCCPAKKETCEKSKTCADKKDCPKQGEAKCCQGAPAAKSTKK